LVKPVTATVVASVVVAVCPPGEAVTVYPVMAEPPLLAGAVHDTDAWVLPGVALTPVGAPGTVDGVTALEADEAAEVPPTLVAVAVKV